MTETVQAAQVSQAASVQVAQSAQATRASQPPQPAQPKVRLAVNLGGLKMQNPVTVASGTFGSGPEYAALWSASQPTPHPLANLGALTTKGVSFEPWPGNPTPRIAEVTSGMLNSIGLQNKGVEAFCAYDLAWLAGQPAQSTQPAQSSQSTPPAQKLPVIVNVCGHTVDEYLRVVQRLEQEAAVSAYELNISCPNVDCGGLGFGTSPALAADVTRVCRAATKRPLIVKLSPNVTDITEIARAVEAAGADALSLINTVTGMAINIRTRRPELARGFGGLSGPAIKPVALYAVHRCYRAVSIPLLGMGGIASASDAIEFFLAGATAVAVGTASFVEPMTAMRLAGEIEQYCAAQGISDIQELIGGLML